MRFDTMIFLFGAASVVRSQQYMQGGASAQVGGQQE
jgi:hypothetical protein